MRSVYLLKEYDGNSSNKIIEVSNNVAFGLIDSGVAREVKTRDVIVKPQYGTSKALKISPRRGVYKSRIK